MNYKIQRYLELCEDFLDVPEAAFSDLHVFCVVTALEDWLGSILEELHKGEQLFDLVWGSLLKKQHFLVSYI